MKPLIADTETQKQEKPKTGSTDKSELIRKGICPECKNSMIPDGGCWLCPSCGFSPCG